MFDCVYCYNTSFKLSLCDYVLVDGIKVFFCHIFSGILTKYFRSSRRVELTKEYTFDLLNISLHVDDCTTFPNCNVWILWHLRSSILIIPRHCSTTKIHTWILKKKKFSVLQHCIWFERAWVPGYPSRPITVIFEWYELRKWQLVHRFAKLWEWQPI